jgi:hypothetical protein
MSDGRPGDTAAAGLKVRAWVEKFDHSGATPRLVETVAIEDGRITGVTRHDLEASDGEAAAGQAGEGAGVAAADGDAAAPAGAQAEHGDEGRPVVSAGKGAGPTPVNATAQASPPGRVDPWATLAIIAKAAQDCGIDLELALRFVAAISLGMQARESGAGDGPARKQ